MRLLRIAVAGTAALLVAGCTDAPRLLGPTTPRAASANAARQVDASGHFDAIVDFRTLVPTPRGQNCLLDVDGQLVFTGTIVGTATGHTQALVSATCAEVASAPPGTYPDVFHSALVFDGTVDGTPVHAEGWYMGRSQPGGGIDGRLVLHGGARGVLDVQARIAVGGDYAGSLVVQ